MELSDRIPLTILTGFLGSGKTTLLNAVLKNPALRDTGIVVNEFGRIGLDHLFLVGAVDNVILLDDGCLCCSVKESFQDTLKDLFNRRQRADVPPFSRVLVETTGMADPAPILQALFDDEFLKSTYRLSGVITTVDAVLGEIELERYQESRMQVALADRLIITKTDLTEAAVPPSLVARLRNLNPSATLHPGGAASLELSEIFSTPAHSLRFSPAQKHDHDEHHHHPHEDGDHTSGIKTESFVLMEAVTWDGLTAWVDFAAKIFGERLLRCKGLFHVAGLSGPVNVQGVQGLFANLDVLETWPDQDRTSRLVCISQGIEAVQIRNSLERFYGAAVDLKLTI